MRKLSAIIASVVLAALLLSAGGCITEPIEGEEIYSVVDIAGSSVTYFPYPMPDPP